MSKTSVKIEPETLLRRKQRDLFSSDIDGEVVMLDMDNNEYYGLESTAARIWALLERPVSLCGLVQALTDEYKVESDQCLIDTQDFLAGLMEKGLVELEEGSTQITNR